MSAWIFERIEDFLGRGLVIDIHKNPEAAGDFGAIYGQDVEPSGTYVLSGKSRMPGYLNGVADLKKPLYLDITDEIGYKRDLAKRYNASGKRLTQKLMRLGYDAIITVRADGEWGEIVLFPNAHFMLA